jgi:phosphatidate cytidylyltransferase
MDYNEFQIAATIVLICAMFFHLLPTIYLFFTKNGDKSRSVWTAYLMWFVILPVLFGPLLAGHLPFIVFSCTASCICTLEFSSQTELRHDLLAKGLMVLLIIILYTAVFRGDLSLFIAIYFFSLIAIIILHLFRQEPEKWHSKLLVSLYIYLYCGVFFSFLPLSYRLDSGKEFLFLYLFLIINNDAFGYIIGSRLGKHKFITKVSPNKTLEGVAAGVMACILIGVLLKPYFTPSLSIVELLLFCIILSFGGTAGDLVMSLSKRAFKLKDFGSVIPAHGGLLDRLDSSILMAPSLFFYLMYR